jgi:hypothetical protein
MGHASRIPKHHADMQTFLIERAIPAALRVDDAANVGLHCRWATDAYARVGAMWLGGVITEDAMWSLVTAEAAEDLTAYWRSLGIAQADVRLRRVVRPIGPFLAAPPV